MAAPSATAGGDLEAPVAGGSASATRRQSATRRARKSSNDGLEKQIEAAEAALHELEDELSDPAAWSTPEASARSTQRHEEARRAVAELYERWEAVAG